MTKPTQTSFSFDSPIGRENSYVNTQLAEMTKSTITIDINKNGNGSATWEVEELEIEEGIGLWFTDNTLVDYDGVFELPKQLLDKLDELGYNTDDMR